MSEKEWKSWATKEREREKKVCTTEIESDPKILCVELFVTEQRQRGFPPVPLWAKPLCLFRWRQEHHVPSTFSKDSAVAAVAAADSARPGIPPTGLRGIVHKPDFSPTGLLRIRPQGTSAKQGHLLVVGYVCVREKLSITVIFFIILFYRRFVGSAAQVNVSWNRHDFLAQASTLMWWPLVSTLVYCTVARGLQTSFSMHLCREMHTCAQQMLGSTQPHAQSAS